MARRYYRSRRTVVVRPKKKWGSNIVDIELTANNATSGSVSAFSRIQLAQNKIEATTPTPVIIKTGNFKLQADTFFGGTSSSGVSQTSATLYIVFVPQGVEPQTYAAAEALIQNHPEWIMAWRVLEGGFTNPSGQYDSTRFTLSSRLKRNLNSGDSVIALLLIQNLSPDQGVQVKGKCQFWTCAN